MSKSKTLEPGARRAVKKQHEEEAIPTAIFNTENADREMQAQYGLSEPTYSPAFLYVERGPGQGQLLEVKQGVIVVGRASVSDLRIQHPSISRRHAQVKRVGEDFFVKDLGSQNGTFVNKQRIATEVEVKVGDTLALGNALVRLRGPMTKAERLAATATVAPPKAVRRSATPAEDTIAQRSSDVGRRSTPAIRIAVFAGAMGFGLAGVLAFAVVKMVTAPPPSAPAATDKRDVALAPAPKEADHRERLIKDALDRKMHEKTDAPAPAAASVVVAEPVQV
ncbi:MAG: FHA domain-containing protein, partial [Archangium sp.]|nr:FHA domain-containing protein [Archangium sp.]